MYTHRERPRSDPGQATAGCKETICGLRWHICGSWRHWLSWHQRSDGHFKDHLVHNTNSQIISPPWTLSHSRDWLTSISEKVVRRLLCPRCLAKCLTYIMLFQSRSDPGKATTNTSCLSQHNTDALLSFRFWECFHMHPFQWILSFAIMWRRRKVWHWHC